MTEKTSFPRIYALLKAAAHDSAKAAEIIRDARCNDMHARIWIKTIAASRWSVLHCMKKPAGGAAASELAFVAGGMEP